MKKLLNIKIERLKRGWTAKQVADQMEITGAFYHYLENGINYPLPNRINQIEDIFNLDHEYLLQEVGVDHE